MYLATMIRGLAEWRRYRMAVRELHSLDDRILRDIGLDRSEIKRVALNGR
jgi:uncharacterized protein YjiS (DUF1127 family)